MSPRPYKKKPHPDQTYANFVTKLEIQPRCRNDTVFENGEEKPAGLDMPRKINNSLDRVEKAISQKVKKNQRHTYHQFFKRHKACAPSLPGMLHNPLHSHHRQVPTNCRLYTRPQEMNISSAGARNISHFTYII